MSYQSAVDDAAQALGRVFEGEGAKWELARLTDENTNTPTDRSKITMEQWCKDVRKKSGLKFATATGRAYKQMWNEFGTVYKSRGLSWTEGRYELSPVAEEYESHPKVAERGANYTAKKGTPQAAAEAVRIALDRPEVADLVIADDTANLAVTKARQRHDTEARAVGEMKDPERRDARRNTEQRDAMYELVKIRNGLFRMSETAKEWEWTTTLREEFTDMLDGVQGALDSLRAVPNFDQELAELLGDSK